MKGKELLSLFTSVLHTLQLTSNDFTEWGSRIFKFSLPIWKTESGALLVNFNRWKSTGSVSDRDLKRRLSFQWCWYISKIRGCIQKFPDWTPGARTANGTALCHYVQLYRYFVSQSSEFWRHNPLYCFSTSVYYYCYFVIDWVRKFLDIHSYIAYEMHQAKR
jgi:hypothetical protein